jgi:hypothetical protein
MSLFASMLSFVLLEPSPVVAPEQPLVSLSWQGSNVCIDRDRAVARLREMLPELPEQIPDEQGRIAVSVEITDTDARVRFVSPRGTDERSIAVSDAGSTCESLVSAVVLVIAIAVEARVDEIEVELDEPEPQSKPPEQQPEPVLAPAAEPPVEPSPTVERRVRGHLGLLGGGGYGPIDAGMGVAALELGVHGRWWRASLRGVWVPPRVTQGTAPNSIGRYDGGFGGARGCVVPPLARGRLELPVCAGIEAGVLRGRGVGSTPNPTSATQPWVAVELGPGLLYMPNRWLALGLELDLVVALLRGGFTIGGEIAQRQAPVGARALAKLEVRFP